MTATLTLTEAAQRAGVDPSALRHAIRLGTLTAIKRGRDWFVEPAEIERYIRERRTWRGKEGSSP